MRVILVALALVGAGWFAVAAHSFGAQDRIAKLALAGDTPTAADLREGRSLASRAKRFAADTPVDQALGVLEFRAGDAAAAVRTFSRATAREPRNAELWALLARVARDQDPRLAAQAAARARTLSPPIAASSISDGSNR